MDAAQFQNYTLGLAQQEAERRHIRTQREQIRDLIRQTQTCDGSTTAAVRNWIREVTLAFNQVGADSIIEIATKTVSGPLRFELERYIEGVIVANQVARAAILWADLRNHISAQFLNPDESAVLRDELDKIRQSVYEPTAQYARRFRDIADVAYPRAHRNADQERLLIKAFARGLKSNELARKLVEQSPATIEAAFVDVTRFCERHDAYTRLGRDEQPMEVGMMEKPASDSTPPLIKMVNSLSSTVEKLATKIAKIEARSPASRDASTHATNDRRNGTPVNTNTRRVPRDDTRTRCQLLCFNCGKPGHYARECHRRYSQRRLSENGHSS